VKTVAALVLAGFVFSGVVIRESDWRYLHPYELGPSGYIVAIGIAGALISFSLAFYVHRTGETRRRFEERIWESVAALHKDVAPLLFDEETLRRHEAETAKFEGERS
jgi:hypothetical protein